ncbi:hypothetical protein HPG69_003675 [Diceros bicornis minor]|uniref:Serpin domain-containing protein n=1 Tax=Diceros bicornis minor TaxID=77932 RepID=A0A7J7ETB9_DICBM|nr:hypothetical protein HPG69_003675 [Diceros bicornis minor]
MNSLSEANTHFAVDLFQQLRKSEKDNIFYSPLSISSALAMTYLGAQGDTALQIGKMFTDLAVAGVAEEAEQVLHFNDVTDSTRGTATTAHNNRKIKNLFPDHSLDFAILVLVNAVYFKGQWNKEFNKEYTVEEKFWLTKLEDKLTAEKLIEWTSSQNMSEKKVELHLPRFKVEESYKLNDTLKCMGMVDAFSPQDANFLGMAERRDLVLTIIVHKSFVEVNEEGTEAAAATGIGTGVTSAPIYESFHCDHPFLFFIKHIKTNSILFLGRVSSP